MYLVPLLAGFGLNWASAFTTTFSRWWGERGGRLASALLRNVLGIPVWALGLILALREPGPLLLRDSWLIEAAIWIFVIGGATLVVLALRTLGRRAAMPSVRDPLVCSGPYRYLRHPIYAGAVLQFVGLALRRPTPPVLLACSLGVVWALVQARLEEADLVQRMPEYRAYRAEVPGFVPRLWRA